MILDAVKAVLAALDAQGLAEHGDEWSELVQEQLAVLQGGYADLRNPARKLVDYANLAAHAAYVYRYMLGHAEFICTVLQKARAEVGAPLLKSQTLWLTSVGGGPGSELLGVLKYLSLDETEPKVSKIIYTVIDKEVNWQHVVETLMSVLPASIKIKLHFHECDVTASALPGYITLKYEEMVVMSFFISEVCALPQKVNVCANLQTMLSSMPKSSLLVYNDNDAYSFYSFLNKRVGAVGNFEQILDIKEKLQAATPNYDGIMHEYVDRYDYHPKLSSSALAKVLRRTKS